MSVNADRFVEIWNKAKSVAQVASQLHIQPVSASVRACGYRKAGRKVKLFPRGRKAA